MVRALFDENISKYVAAALNAYGCNVHHVRTVAVLGQGARDLDVMRWCRQNDAFLVTADYKMVKTRKYIQFMHQHGVSVAVFRPPSTKSWNAKEWFRQVVRRMEDMEHEFSTRSPCYRRYTQRGKPKDFTL